nr:AraC family transcriptional regulator [uncultured Allomuricauda sp.]
MMDIVWKIIFICFAFQGFSFAILLVVKKSSSQYANIIWAFFLTLFSLNLIYNVLYWFNPTSRVTESLDHMYFIPLSLYGPLFFFYIRNLVKNTKINIKKDIYHFIPLFIVFANYGNFYLLGVDAKIAIIKEGGINNFVLINDNLLYVAVTLILIGYGVVSFIISKNSYLKDFEMRLWLRLKTTAFSLFGFSWLTYYVLFALNILSVTADYMMSLVMITFIGMSTYFGFIHSKVFNGQSLSKAVPFIKYRKSGLSKEVLKDYKKKLLKVMTVENLHLNSELKLTDLAEKLNISRHHTSQIINESFGMSFYEYINKLRVMEAQRILQDEGSINMNIDDIAFISGFNNRMSFYTSFKKYSGATPSQYRNKSLAS